jgi:large repetitive protein
MACPTQTTTYVLTVMEAGGCMGRDTVILTVNNNAPQLVGVPANVTVACSAVPVPATVTDLYGAPVTMSQVRVNGNCPGNYTLTRTWTATDACSRTATASQVITVQDLVAPTFAGVPANVTVTCSADVPAAATVRATDACDTLPTVRVVDVTSNETCVNRKTITRTWTATDACGNSATTVQVITVNDNVAPVLAGVPANITVACQSEVPTAVTVTATDNCAGGVPRVTMVDVISNETCVNRKTITRTWTATDACGNTATGVQVISINDNVPPVLVGIPANLTLTCASELQATPMIMATDNCTGAAPTVVLTESYSNILCVNKKTLTRTWTATDACGNTATGSQVIVINDNIAPVFTSVPANTTINCNDIQPNVLAVATDNCGTPTVTMTNTTSNSGSTYTITRTFTATDACGNTATATQILTVRDNTPPVIANMPPNITVACVADVPSAIINPTVTDACDPNPRLTMLISTIDSTCFSRKTIVRTWTATDAAGNTSIASQTIRVNDNVAPVITPINPRLAGFRSGDTLTMSCENLQIFQMGDATAVDNCDGNITPNTPRFYFEDLARRRGVCAIDGYTLLIECRWVAIDLCGNQSEFHVFLKVTDNKPPVLAACPANVTVTSASAIPTAPTLTATDNCTDVVNVTMNQVTAATGTNCDYTLTRTWTAADACGNFTTCSQVITVKDSIAVKFVTTDVTCAGNDGTITMIPSAGLTYTWSDGATGANRNNLRAGTYTVTATSSGACQKVLTITVGTNCSCVTPIATVQKTDATCGNTNGTATIAVDNVANYTFTWSSGGASTNSRTGLAVGSYTVTVSRNGIANCTTVASVTIANNTAGCCTPPVATIQKVDATCGASNGTATVVVDNVANYTYAWSDGNTTSSRTALAAGSYTVTVSRVGVANCTAVVSVTIGNNTAGCCTPPVATIQKADATCGASNGTATVVVDNVANYTYAWSDGNTTSSRTALAAGSYTVTVSRVGVANCTTVVSVTIGNNTAGCCTPPVATVQKADATCGAANGTVTLALDNAANYTYAWSDGNTTSSRTALAAGSYSVTVSRVGVANCTTVLPITIANNTVGCCTPPVATVQKTDAICGASNGTATLTVDNVANYTFTWSSGGASTNSRTGLAAGGYTVTVSRVGVANCTTVVNVAIANNTASCCGDFIVQSSIVKVITDCSTKADVCVEIPSSSINSYTITDNGAAYTAGFGTCLAGSTLRFGSGDHTVIFTTPTGCKDTLLVKVACTAEIVINRTITFPTTDSTCLTATQLGLTGTIVSVVNECAATANNTEITISPISKCLIYKSLSFGIDTACLRVTTSTGGVATVKFIITVNLPRCGKIIPQDSVIVTDACTATPKVCVNIPFDVIPDYNILLNGVTYTGAFDACKNDTTFAYTYFTIPGRGATGPYSLDYWTVNGTTYTMPSVNNLDELVSLMNTWDPTGHWMLSSSTLTIIGGDRRKTYGGIKMTRLSNNSYGVMQLNTNIVPQATILDIPRGQSTLVFIKQSTGCADTLRVNAACLTPQYIETAMLVGAKDTFCLATNELMGSRYRVSKLVAGTNTYARYSDLSGTVCVSRLGLAVGTEKTTYVISDEYGFNDTTYVTTHVYARAVKRPRAFADFASTIKSQPVLIDVMSNDSLNTNNGRINIVAKPKHGTVIVTSDMRIIYTPDINYCSTQPEVFSYELCNTGGCDTAQVQVTVSCDKIKIYTGFSPNGDGINDVFVIEGIEKFQNNTVSVYNRWGTEVMKTKGYKNDWNGKWNNVDLPDGTYFYLFNDGEGNIKSGYVQIMR